MLAAGIDIGTTSISIVMASALTGETVKIVSAANDSGMDSPKPWERMHDPQRTADLVGELIRQCSPEWSEVASIGISCQMHGILYTDEKGAAVSPLFTWQDGRGGLPMPDGERSYAGHLSEIGMRPVYSGYGMATHYFNTMNGLIPAEAARMCTIGDYIAMRLSGLTSPVTDPSNAASLGMYSPEYQAFDRLAIERAGMNPSMLPALAGENGVIGRTADGKPVVCAIGDNQASFLGAVAQLEHMLLVNVGTGSQVSVYTDRLEEPPGLETRPFPGGGYLIVGAPLSGGKSYAMLEKFYKDTCRAFGASIDDHDIYKIMNELAGQALRSGIGPLRIGTQFYGTRNDPQALGYIAGLSADNFRPGHFAAAMLTGIADELMTFFLLMPEHLRSSIMAATGSGNGIRKNPVMQRLLRERLHVPFRLAEAAEEAAFGAAIYAAARAGLHPDVKSALAAMQRTNGAG